MKEKKLFRWTCRDRSLSIGARPLIMGILNVTPDSFSDGGLHFNKEAAVAHGIRMVEEGADIIDVGGESSRPGASEVSADEEMARVIPVILELGKTAAVVSVDTTKSAVARGAMKAGARIINDVSALTHDPAMADVAREFGAGVLLMHMQGTPRIMQKDPQYEDVVAEVSGYLKTRIDDAIARGVEQETLAVDPGIGFGKTLEHNLELLANLNALDICDRPIVVGLSRKSFLGKITGRAVEERLAGSLAALVCCVLGGAHVLRVHDVKESVDAVKVAMALGTRQRGE
jgi:dihydropteroate synthase